jgi:voltage-gated potassium channel
VPETPARFARISHAARGREQILFLRRLGQLCGLIVVLLLLGTAGFVITEGSSVLDSFVWALDTIATVGSVRSPGDADGEVVKIVLIVLGVGTLFYALVTVTEFFVAGHLSGLLYERRASRMIEQLSDHYLICGFGRVGRQAARDLQAAGVRFVVVDPNPDIREAVDELGVPLIEGPPSDDDVLRRAGLDRAHSLIACMDSDAENIFTTLTARELRSDITIVARASAEDSEKKLKRAGADRVISPYKASGTEMARSALHPQVSGVVDVATEYRMEEIQVTEGCEGCGLMVGEVRGGSIIVAVRRGGGQLVAQPPEDLRLDPGDVVVALGTPRTMDRLEDLFAGKARA